MNHRSLPLVIIQARLGSSRLPGKVMAPLGQSTLLGTLLTRLEPLHQQMTLMVATSTEGRDDCVAMVAKEMGVLVGRGSEHDVLGRIAQCVISHAGDPIVRLTADNPCVDAELVQTAVETYEAHPGSYVNTHLGGYPAGLSVEVVARDALLEADVMATAADDREHVTKWIRERPMRWPHASPRCPVDAAGLRLTVDTSEDLDRLRALDRESGGLTDESHLALLRLHQRLARFTKSDTLPPP